MSKRANYDLIADEFDTDMATTGTDVICAMLQFYTGKPLKELHVLDAGCGTGNYTKVIIEHDIGHVALLDASQRMLEVAKVKLGAHVDTGTITDIVCDKMPPLPFPDESFDAVMFNFALNHLDNADDGYPVAVETLKEAKRVLRPGGLIVISTILKSVQSENMWVVQFDETLIDRHLAGSPSLKEYEELFKTTGITCMQKMNILGSNVYPNYFKNPERTLFHFLHYINATENERNTAYKKFKKLRETGELERWIKEHDKTETQGLVTMFICQADGRNA